MRTLVMGAGAVGAYFGGRLLQVGRDITFLVRPGRAAALAKGLRIRSRLGNIDLPTVPTVAADQLGEPYDLILLSCKAYDLDGAMRALMPAVGTSTAILPLLNGMRHLGALCDHFGAERILGGQCTLSVTLTPDGDVEHLNDFAQLSFGELNGSSSARAHAIQSALSGAKFELRLSDAILQEMWEKWAFIATAAGMTCLMRATVGDIVRGGGADLIAELFDECATIAEGQGFALRPAVAARYRAMFASPESTLAASMLRDMELGSRTEADHILDDLLNRSQKRGRPTSLLRVCVAHLNSYDARRAREA